MWQHKPTGSRKSCHLPCSFLMVLLASISLSCVYGHGTLHPLHPRRLSPDQSTQQLLGSNTRRTALTKLQSIFWQGINLGNLNIFPFEGSPYAHTALEIQQLLQYAVMDLASAGGNTLRVWFHVDGSRNPVWSPYMNQTYPGVVASCGAEAVQDLQWLLRLCHQHGVKVLLVLWSHDILAVRRDNPITNRERALYMMTHPEGTQAYIDNCLIPLVNKLRTEPMYSDAQTTYADAILAYEVFNEPEGITNEARLYHNYMYNVQYGRYQFKEPKFYDASPDRQLDYRSIAFLKRYGGYMGPVSEDKNWEARFFGWHFLAGTPPQDSKRPPCYRLRDSTHWMTLSDPALTGLDDSRRAWQRFQDVVEAKPAETYDDVPPYMWFNELMYWDVLAKHNSEFAYLLPLIATCQLQTVDVPMAVIQRFVSQLAAAIHRADPSALVTVGSHSTPYVTDTERLKGDIDHFEKQPRNLFSDEALRLAFDSSPEAYLLPDGTASILQFDPLGVVDFYAPHGYPDWGHDDDTFRFSPFFVSASKLELDKPCVIGEFWDKISDSTDLTPAVWSGLQDKGYTGGLAWAYFEVVEQPGCQLDAPRTIRMHEKSRVYIELLQTMNAGKIQNVNMLFTEPDSVGGKRLP